MGTVCYIAWLFVYVVDWTAVWIFCILYIDSQRLHTIKGTTAENRSTKLFETKQQKFSELITHSPKPIINVPVYELYTELTLAIFLFKLYLNFQYNHRELRADFWNRFDLFDLWWALT